MHCLNSLNHIQYLPDSLILSVSAANLSDDLFKPTKIIARVNIIAKTIIRENVLAIMF
jgi:hypothetical protein